MAVGPATKCILIVTLSVSSYSGLDISPCSLCDAEYSGTFVLARRIQRFGMFNFESKAEWRIGLKCLALTTALGSLLATPARAQSVEELKAMVLKLQQRVEQ